MRLTPKYISIFLNILFGVAWAMSIFLFFYGFTSSGANIFIKFLNGLLYFFFGLFFVLMLEAMAKIFESFELQKEIMKKLEEKPIDD